MLAAAGIARGSPDSWRCLETEFGTGYDLVLITNFLHHFDIPTCTQFLRKVHAVLRRAEKRDCGLVPNDDRFTADSGGFRLMMLATTPTGGCLHAEGIRGDGEGRGLYENELRLNDRIRPLIVAYK